MESLKRCVPQRGGQQLSLHIAAGLGLAGNEAPIPECFSSFGGFADGVPVENGYVKLPEIPGIGFEAKQDLFKVLQTRGMNNQRW